MKVSVIEQEISAQAVSGQYPLIVQGLDNPEDWQGWVWYRTSPAWIEAFPLNSILDIASQMTIHLLLLRHRRQDEKVICIYPVSSEEAVSSITSQQGALSLNALRISSKTESAKVACIIGMIEDRRQVTRLVQRCVQSGRAWLSGVDVGSLEIFSSPTIGGPFDGVGFCTWSSLGEDIHPTRENVGELLDSLVNHRIPVQTFILDDGWQDWRTFRTGPGGEWRGKSGPEEWRSTWRHRGLHSFSGSPALGDLKDIVIETKRRLREVDGVGKVDFGVWLALTGGYWDGVDPESPLIDQYKCKRYQISRTRTPLAPNDPFASAYVPHGKSDIWLPPPSESLHFWTDWFNLLKAAGVDFLKVDNQASLIIVDGVDGSECQYALWENMVAASDLIFGHGKVLHCMAHHEGMFAGPQGMGLLNGGERFVWRNSDDFGRIHKIDDAQQQHIVLNLTNSLVTSNLCMVPDADMFMSAAQSPLAHALLRSHFPGPLLLSDRRGEHDLSLIRRMTAKDKSGLVRVVKTLTPALLLSRRSLDTSVVSPCDGKGVWGGVMTPLGASIAAWNVHYRSDQNTKAQDIITTEDIEDVVGGPLEGEWMIYKAGFSDGHPVACSAASGIPVLLDYMGCERFSAAPIRFVNRYKVACFGLIDQLAGMVGATFEDVPESLNDSLRVRALYEGTLGFVVLGQEPQINVQLDGMPIPAAVVSIDSLSSIEQAWMVNVVIGENAKRDWIVDVSFR